jgi:uncharacterized protein (UPF0332 family)
MIKGRALFEQARRCKTRFNQRFVKAGEVSREKGRLFNRLFEARQEGDYIDFVHFDRETVEPWIPEAIEFVEAMSDLAEQSK